MIDPKNQTDEIREALVAATNAFQDTDDSAVPTHLYLDRKAESGEWEVLFAHSTAGDPLDAEMTRWATGSDAAELYATCRSGNTSRVAVEIADNWDTEFDS